MSQSHMGPQRSSRLNPHFAEKKSAASRQRAVLHSLLMADRVSHLDFLTPSSVLTVSSRGPGTEEFLKSSLQNC